MIETITIDLTDKWRTRFLVYSEALLSGPYLTQDCPIVIISDFDLPPSHYHVDVFIERDKFQDIREILYFTLDVINEFISQISFVSYSPSELISAISICPHEVQVDEEFEMTIFNGDYEINKVEIKNTDLVNRVNHEQDGVYLNLLHLLKQALSTDALELRFLNLFATLDFIADNETVEKVVSTCPHCDKEIEGFKATSQFIRRTFQERGIDAFHYNQIRKLRGKIAHGSGVRSMSFYSELLSSLAILESVAYDEVIKRGPLKVKRNSKIIAPIPHTTITAVKVSNPTASLPSVFGIVNYMFSVASASFTGLQNAMETPPDQFSGTFGPHPTDRGLEVPREAWPY